NNRKRALEAAEADRAAKEQEVAAAKAKQVAKGWVEKVVDGGTVVTLLPARVRKAAKLPDGSAVPRAPDAKLDASEVALLARQKNASKAGPKTPKRKGGCDPDVRRTTQKHRVLPPIRLCQAPFVVWGIGGDKSSYFDVLRPKKKQVDNIHGGVHENDTEGCRKCMAVLAVCVTLLWTWNKSGRLPACVKAPPWLTDAQLNVQVGAGAGGGADADGGAGAGGVRAGGGRAGGQAAGGQASGGIAGRRAAGCGQAAGGQAGRRRAGGQASGGMRAGGGRDAGRRRAGGGQAGVAGRRGGRAGGWRAGGWRAGRVVGRRAGRRRAGCGGGEREAIGRHTYAARGAECADPEKPNALTRFTCILVQAKVVADWNAGTLKVPRTIQAVPVEVEY
ncbi:hypothetical protein B0H14DRAFT_2624666, partial [Mycena olivaceomarginata]